MLYMADLNGNAEMMPWIVRSHEGDIIIPLEDEAREIANTPGLETLESTPEKDLSAMPLNADIGDSIPESPAPMEGEPPF